LRHICHTTPKTLERTGPLAITAVSLRIRLPDRAVTAEIATKSLRKGQTAIRETGADNIARVLQGHLVAGDRVAEAGLSALPKVHPKVESPSPQATKNNDGAVSTEVAALDR
jgi:hypothetical protein